MDMTTRIQVAIVRADMAIMAGIRIIVPLAVVAAIAWTIYIIGKGAIHGIKSRRSH